MCSFSVINTLRKRVICDHHSVCTNILRNCYKKRYVPGPEELYSAKTNAKLQHRLYVWGRANHGALGELKLKGKVKGLQICHRPVRKGFALTHRIADFSCGYGYTLYAVKNNPMRKVFGSGINTDSQIGYHAVRPGNPLGLIYSIVPLKLPLQSPRKTNVIKVATGRAHSIVLTDQEGAFVFGNNSFGQCARGIVEDEDYSRFRPMSKIKQLGGERIIHIICGQDHSLFITENGKVYSCGNGADGQTGLGHFKNTTKPTLVEGDIKDEKIIKISSTCDTALALNDKGEVFGWGNSEYLQLSIQDGTQQVNTPMRLQNLVNLGKIRDIACGGTFCMVLNEDRELFVWGFGILGKGPKLSWAEKPSKIPSTLFGCNQFNQNVTVESIYCGVTSLAAVTNYEDLFMWGKNEYSQLGLGHENHQYFPLQVSIGARVINVSCGIDHTIAMCKSFI